MADRSRTRGDWSSPKAGKRSTSGNVEPSAKDEFDARHSAVSVANCANAWKKPMPFVRRTAPYAAGANDFGVTLSERAQAARITPEPKCDSTQRGQAASP